MNKMHLTKKKCLAYSLMVGLSVSARLLAGEMVGRPLKTGDEPRVDNWVDAWMLAQSGPAGKAVEGRFVERHGLLDTTDAKQGLFAVRFTVDKKSRASAFGFSAGPYLKHWSLSGDFALHAWIKASAASEPGTWRLAVYDATGHKAEIDLVGMAADGKWREYSWPLASLQSKDGFDAGTIRAVQVEATLPQGASLWLDDLFFQRGKEVFGVSDKTVTQYMAEAEATRAKRVDESMANAGGGGHPSLAPLYNGVDLEETNRKIIEWTEKAGDGSNGNWGLFENVFVNEAYFGFSSKGRIKPGVLSAACERKLLEYYWKHCEVKNDIATARQSPWWVTGSENHDINFKMANLLSSQIFMHEPNYASRIYPDLGRMQGYGYGDSPTFRAGQAAQATKLGSGNYKDGKSYKAVDHYKAWVVFWKNYFFERARHGFFIENNAATYMSHTQHFLHDIYAWCEDEELRREARMFIDVVWAQWSQDQALGITGGSVTRGSPGWTRMGRMAEFLMGGPGNGSFYAYSDYQWPRQVWEMLLARPAMGEYAFVARKPNEAQDVWPQPPGTEYTIIIRPDSRLVHYSWVTPDYVMGTRMDHPDALYCHLSGSKEAIIFATTPQAMIEWLAGAQHLAVQDRSVALIQPKKTIRYQHPMWFPGYPSATEPLEVLFGADLDRIEEKDGWVFVQEGNAYAAVRVVVPAEDTMVKGVKRTMPAPVDFEVDGFGLFKPEPQPYTWQIDEEKRKGIILQKARKLVAKDLNASLIIEASRKPHHATLEAFEQDVLNNPIRLKQVIGSGYLLTYRGCGKEAKELYLNCANNEIPKIDGKYISYDSPAFDSPWLKGSFGSGVITLTGPLSKSKTVLDFNKITCQESKGE